MEKYREHLFDYQLAVESRNRYWFDRDNPEETLSFLRYNNLSYIAVDEPQGFESSVPPIADVTGKYGMVRFHGRNLDKWESKGLTAASDRFDY